MLYIVNRDGNPVDGHRAGAMRTTARAIWAQLSSQGIAPVKWMTDVNLSIGNHYHFQMQDRFEELRLCEAGWKANQIAIDYYPSWRNSQQNKGKFNSNKENIIEINSDAEDGSNSDGSDSNALDNKSGSTKRKPKGKQTQDLPEMKKLKKNAMTATQGKGKVKVRYNAYFISC